MSSQIKQCEKIPAWFMTLIAIPIVVGLLWFGRSLLIPLVITGLLFILTLALVDRLERLRIFGWAPPRWGARALSGAIVIATVLALVFLISGAAENMQDALPRYEERISGLVTQLEGILGPQILASIERALNEINLAAWLASAIGQLGATLSVLVLVALYLAFLMMERSKWTEKIDCLATNAESGRRTREVLGRVSEGIKQYMWVNAVTSAMSGAIAFLIFSLIDLDFAPMLAFMVFLVGFIPTIGAFIGIALPCLVALVQFDGLGPFLVVLLGYGLADQIISNLIQPSMQGRSLNLSTFMVMVSLTFFATIWGGIGAFLAVPIMVVMIAVFAEIPATRWIAVLLSGDGNLHAATVTRQ